jgi:DnaK suppressor protein
MRCLKAASPLTAAHGPAVLASIPVDDSTKGQVEGNMAGGKRLTDQFIRECRTRLLEMKTEILNRTRSLTREYEARDRGGSDEGDMTMEILAENDFLSTQGRLKARLIEIDHALSRIEKGLYGICEETDEPIEVERLRALPWTRLSIEGAEIRESLERRFART